jgi:hypothetical protein
MVSKYETISRTTSILKPVVRGVKFLLAAVCCTQLTQSPSIHSRLAPTTSAASGDCQSGLLDGSDAGIVTDAIPEP